MSLMPLEKFLEVNSGKAELFPNRSTDYFIRYQNIKSYLEDEVYPYIGAATSAEDGGIYTDHSKEHFNAVIQYAGLLLQVPTDLKSDVKISITPYEVFVLLVSILLHDAGNIFGRRGHEKHPTQIFIDMGRAVCPDRFEAANIGKIAQAHGGKRILESGASTKDTIGSSQLKDSESYGGEFIRQRLIAAIVRFADEICEDRSRAARYLLNHDSLPKWSEAYHHYAAGISSVSIDHRSKSVNLSFQLDKANLLNTMGKGESERVEEVYLIDEIFSRLEKMFLELIYCRRFMSELIKINKIRALVQIYDENMDQVKEKTFELQEVGYPNSTMVLADMHENWCGPRLKSELEGN